MAVAVVVLVRLWDVSGNEMEMLVSRRVSLKPVLNERGVWLARDKTCGRSQFYWERVSGRRIRAQICRYIQQREQMGTFYRLDAPRLAA